MKSSIGRRLMALRERSGLSLGELARLSGYKGASSIQKLFKNDYDPEVLDPKIAERLSTALIGRGNPPIELSELGALTSSAPTLDNLVADLKHYTFLASAYIGMHKTRRIGDNVETENGVKIPLFVREDMSDGIPIYPCPSYLRPRGVIGLYVTVGNMWPRFEEGEPVFYEHQRPPARGDDVIVTLVSDASLDGACILGRLRLMQDDEIQIDVLSPSDRIVLPRTSVISVYRLMHPTDMLEPLTYAN